MVTEAVTGARPRRCRPAGAAARSRRAGRRGAAIVVCTSARTGPPKGAVLPRRASRRTRRAGRGVGVDEARRRRPWPAALPRPRADPRDARPVRAAAASPPRPLQRRGRCGGAAATRRSLLRRPDHVPPARPPRPRATRNCCQALQARPLLVSGTRRAPGRRARADRAPHRPADRRALRHDRDAHEHWRARRRRAAAGLRRPPLEDVEIRLVTDDGDRSRPPTTRRSARSRSAARTSSSSTWNRPDATAEAMTDGWFKTGDLADPRADGYIRIVGRRAIDLDQSGGYKIGAGEIEGALLSMPASPRPPSPASRIPTPASGSSRRSSPARARTDEGRAGRPRRRPARRRTAPRSCTSSRSCRATRSARCRSAA